MGNKAYGYVEVDALDSGTLPELIVNLSLTEVDGTTAQILADLQAAGYTNSTRSGSIVSMYIPVDEPWGYYLGLAEYQAGDTTSYRIDIDCEARPEVPTGPLHITGGSSTNCGADSLTIVLDGTPLFALAVDSTFYPRDNYRPAHWSWGFRGSYDVPQGDYRLEWTGFREGTVACDSYNSCWTSRGIQIRYGKLTVVHLPLRCPG